MNGRPNTTRTIELDDARKESVIRLHGRWFVLARILWIAVVVLILALLVATIPAFSNDLHNGCTTAPCQMVFLSSSYSAQQYQAAGFPVTFALLYFYVLSVFVSLTFLTLGTVIFWLKSQDLMALFSSFALVTFAVAFNNGSLVALVPSWWLPIEIITFLGNVSFGIFFLLFPNGRFVPRWTRWLIIVTVCYHGIASFFPTSTLANSLPFGLLFMGFLVSVVALQVYRYLRVSNQAERQQTKWVVFAVAIAFVGILSVALLYWYNVLSLFPPNPRADLITLTAINVFILLIPLSIAFAILHSRLWDIDIIINRTLVYGTLTVLLALVYFGLVIGLGYLVRLFTGQAGQSPVIIVASTLVIAALFQPLRHRIQAIIDRSFYRRKYETAKVVEAFSATLRNEVDLTQLREHLISVVRDTMQPEHISLWLREPASKPSRPDRMPPK
jgi:hypothetical protein